MFDNEKQFEDFIDRLPLVDNIDHQHKEKLEKILLESYVPADQRQLSHTKWSSIMNIKTVKYAVAAAIVILACVFFVPENEQSGINTVELLNNICKAENRSFFGEGITHIITEITVLPLPEELRKESVLDDTVTEEDLYGPALWLNHNWLPMCSLKSNGQFRLNNLKLSPDIENEYVITDQAWFDPASGYFKRVMAKEESLVMGNAWDGNNIYESFSENGEFKKIVSPTNSDFKAPVNPAQFLGLSVGICQKLSGDNGEFNLTYMCEEITDDGKEVKVYRTGFEDSSGNTSTYWLFKIDSILEQVAEMEFYLAGHRHIHIKRVLLEKIATYEDQWALSASDYGSHIADNTVSMHKDMYVDDVSVQQMVEKASYQTYLFSTMPTWCNTRRIFDVVDPPSPGHRMFLIDYFTENNPKHVLLIQSKSYNGMFAGFLSPDTDGSEAYIKTDKYRVYRGGPQEKWWTKVVLDSCAIDCQDDREGYLIWTGTETIPALVVNGTTTVQELKVIVETMLTSEEYLAK